MSPSVFSFFFFNDTATTEIYTLSLHDALPISPSIDFKEPCNATRELLRVCIMTARSATAKRIAPSIPRDGAIKRFTTSFIVRMQNVTARQHKDERRIPRRFESQTPKGCVNSSQPHRSPHSALSMFTDARRSHQNL